ncbi:MAG: CRISPR-associated endonuclease Cas2 [Bdellovibrionales bacterium]|nr:CRISPR-associated endonuclease Cas2 [Bdellovibrionales bacterium]
MKEEKLFIVSYDITDPKRWRKIFKILNGYGNWLQLSVFQCQMNELKKEKLVSELDTIIDKSKDQILFIDVGLKNKVKTKVMSIGKKFQMIEKKPMIF